MPYKLTPLQNIKKHLKSSKALIARIEKELADERTDKAERSRLLVSLTKLTKDVRSLENKRAKLSAQARGKMPLINRRIGLQNLEHVMRGNGCLLACYSFRNRSIRVEIPDSKNQMSMAKYPAFVASRDDAERQARQIQDALESNSNAVSTSVVNVSAEAIQNIGQIMGNAVSKSVVESAPAPKKAHICDEGCRLLGCSVQDALQAAVRAAAAAMAAPSQTGAEAETESEPASVEASVDIDTPPVSNAVGASVVEATAPAKAAEAPDFNRSSGAEILRWLRSQTPRQVAITPDSDLEGQTLEYWKDKATITVKRMIELYHAFSSTLSREASMQFDNFRDRHLIPMLSKILYYEPETVKSILGDDAAILLENSQAPAKPVIDRTTQVLTELRWRQKNVR